MGVGPPDDLDFAAGMQEKLATRCDQLTRTREADEKRFTEHRLPWDKTTLTRTQQAALNLCALYLRCAATLVHSAPQCP